MKPIDYLKYFLKKKKSAQVYYFIPAEMSYRPQHRKKSSSGSSCSSLPHPFYMFSGCIISLLLLSFVYQFGQLSTTTTFDGKRLGEIHDSGHDNKLRGESISNTVNNNSPKQSRVITDITLPTENHDYHQLTTTTTSHHSNSNSHFLESTVLLIICANRQDYLKRTLEKVISYHPQSGIPILISEDGFHRSMQDVIGDATSHLNNIAPGVNLTHVHHPFYNQPAPNGYHKLSRHFKWAIDSAFQFQPSVDNVIVLEEDLIIAPDFYSYFAATSSLLASDPSLLAVSAWNDNGQSHFVKDEKQLYRSDFFPGLGWMVNKRVWEELSPIWPAAYWDDWLRYINCICIILLTYMLCFFFIITMIVTLFQYMYREPARRKDRHFIRPEISRTFHIGVVGVSNSEFANVSSIISYRFFCFVLLFLVCFVF